MSCPRSAFTEPSVSVCALLEWISILFLWNLQREPGPAILPIASSCCTEVSRHISRRLLERVNICRIQRADGDCDLAAVILHIRRRRVCVSPHSHVIKQWMKEQEAKKKAKGNLCHKKKQDGKRNSKGAHQGKPETHGYKTPY
ncbi:C-C motif chemokine 28 isoform X1 [Panthera tigris]|uniref:C-C motif chemokine 28 isoform X1 n=1 Tax=Panthera leo TaxID=9689 RepID=UPI001C6A87E3|nr:C-C motif chemokine 28 isoform X1 [Panthera leo]XP_042851190.1 C-C motif chemokine 28 isoform X1 [Panthera tigris]